MSEPEAAPETPGEQPGKSLASEPRPAHAARAFQPSTFASRGKPAEQPRRLVSLGISTVYLDGFGPGKKAQSVEMEYLYDRDNPSRHYRRMVPNGTLEPLRQTTGLEDQVKDLGPVSPSLAAWRSGTFPEALAETVTPVA